MASLLFTIISQRDSSLPCCGELPPLCLLSGVVPYATRTHRLRHLLLSVLSRRREGDLRRNHGTLRQDLAPGDARLKKIIQRLVFILDVAT